jgi:hypothetical protein
VLLLAIIVYLINIPFFVNDLNANFYTTDEKHIMRFKIVFNPQNLQGNTSEKNKKKQTYIILMV